MKKSAKSVNRINIMNNNPKRNDKVIITSSNDRWEASFCNLWGYTFELRRLYKKDYKGFCEWRNIDVDYYRLVLTAQNDAGDIKLVQCLDNCLYEINREFQKLRELGYNKSPRMYELSRCYASSTALKHYYELGDEEMEEKILNDALMGYGDNYVNFIENGKFRFRITPYDDWDQLRNPNERTAGRIC